jgi:hypothetical protein
MSANHKAIEVYFAMSEKERDGQTTCHLTFHNKMINLLNMPWLLACLSTNKNRNQLKNL